MFVCFHLYIRRQDGQNVLRGIWDLGQDCALSMDAENRGADASNKAIELAQLSRGRNDRR
jgi:hypothetical protein